MSTRVYLSYSAADTTFATQLGNDLRAAGEDVETSAPELDSLDLTTSDNLERLNESLARREVLVAVLSPDSLASTRVNRELYVASGRTTSGAMQVPIVVMARPVATASLPLLWSRGRLYDTSSDYSATLPVIVKAVEGTENAKATGLAALVDGKGFSPQAIWGRFGVRGTVIVVSALLAMLSFGMTWFSVGLACKDQGCSLGKAAIAPGPNNVDGYFLAADKHVNVVTGTAAVTSPGVRIQNGYSENNGIFDPHLPLSITGGTQTVVVSGDITFTMTPGLTFSFSLLRFFLPIAAIMLLMPLVVAVAGFKPTFAKTLILLPIFVELMVMLIYIAAAPEAFHSSETIHFAPGPGGGAWLAFLLTVIAISFALSIPTKPPTQQI